MDDESTAVDAELVDGSRVSSSSESDHLAPFSSDLSMAALPCSRAGVMAPDVGLLDCVDAEVDAPRAACAYENGTDAEAGLTASDCVDMMTE